MLMTSKQIAERLRNLRDKNFKIENLDEIRVARRMKTLFANLNNLISYRYSYTNIKDIISIDDKGVQTKIGFACHEWDADRECYIDVAVFDYSKSEIVAKLSMLNQLGSISSVENGKLYFHLDLIDVFDQE